MYISPLVTDNIAELLVKIIEFTHARQKILTRNLRGMRSPGFEPKDVPADEFSQVLSGAVDEHVANGRLVLYDTENIKFGISAAFDVKANIDERAKTLLDESPDKYLELQINKLRENSLNQRIAAELLRQKEEAVSVSD